MFDASFNGFYLNLDNIHNTQIMYSYANKMPFLTWMVDAYTLDRDEDFAKGNRTSPMPVNEWCEKNQFMIELKKSDKGKHEALRAAMISYGKRIIPRLQYSPPTKVDDDIQEIANYVCGIPKFIKKLLYIEEKMNKIKNIQKPIAPPFCVCKQILSIPHTMCKQCDNLNVMIKKYRLIYALVLVVLNQLF